MPNDASGVLWRRLKYMLSPQLDLYNHLSDWVKGKSVLEVGFGTGFGTVLYSGKADHVDAVEVDKSAVQFANNVFPLRNIRWFEGDISSPDFPRNAKYDIIVCVEVLEHVPKYNQALENISKLGEMAIISGPNANADLIKNDIHEREWTAMEFRQQLENYFDDVVLYDYSLTEEQGDDTTRTPLVAVCYGEKG